MKAFLQSMLSALTLLLIAPSFFAEAIYDCAAADGTNCQDNDVLVAEPEDPMVTNDVQCRKCVWA